MHKKHTYTTNIEWTGNNGSGTDDAKNYERSHTIRIEGKPNILGSSDAPFRGDITKHNPEDFLVASLSSCHMLWYLHLCADAGVVVIDYADTATGTMVQTANGGGHFEEVMLNPVVTVKEGSMIKLANELHHKAHELCFIANSVNFKVSQNPVAKVG